MGHYFQRHLWSSFWHQPQSLQDAVKVHFGSSALLRKNTLQNLLQIGKFLDHFIYERQYFQAQLISACYSRLLQSTQQPQSRAGVWVLRYCFGHDGERSAAAVCNSRKSSQQKMQVQRWLLASKSIFFKLDLKKCWMEND